MVNFDLRLFNFPAERLFKPRQRLAPVEVPDYVKKSLCFKESGIEELSEDSDVIIFTDYFSWNVGFDNNVEDIKEFVSTHGFFNLAKDSENKEAILKIITSLKYLFASKRMLQGLVADDSIFCLHLPYLIEASYDMECSISLTQLDYFKQSLQTLRNVIEATLTHAYFALKDMDYDDLLEAEDQRIPPIKEIIRFLRTENLLIPEKERQVFDLYKKLSGAVHSEVKKLNSSRNSGSYNSFLEWYEDFVNVAQLNFQIIFRMIEIGI